MTKAVWKYLILINLIALFVAPELNSVHYDPERQFWAEITFAWSAVILFILSSIAFKKSSIPGIVIPIGFFAIYLLIQPSIVTIQYVGLSYIALIEFFICILLSISINTIKEELGLTLLVEFICFALLIGAILQSIIGLIQYLNFARSLGFIFYDGLHPTTNIFGHFGQRNHYSHYLTWAFFAVIYLYIKNIINRPFFYSLVLWFDFSLTIASSRSVFIYFAIAILISWVFRNKTDVGKRFCLLIIACFVSLLIFQYLYPIINHLFTTSHVQSGLERLSADDGAGRRKIEWLKAIMIFKHYPMFGVGWNQFARQSVVLHHLFPGAAANSGLFTNCHNLILQLLAETGLIGTGIFVLGIAWVLARVFKNNVTIETILFICMLCTTFGHSMVEYPLWYMYFLGGMIVFISIDAPLIRVERRWICFIGFIPVVWLMYLFVMNSLIFDTMVRYFNAPSDPVKFNVRANYIKNLVDNNQLWAYDASYSLDNYINVSSKLTNSFFDVKSQYYYTNQFSDFHPYPHSIMKQAMLAWDTGNKPRAIFLVKMAVNAFPVYKHSFKLTLSNKKYAPLLKLVQ